MVGAWTQPLDQAKVASRAPRRDAHGTTKILAREVRRTTKGDQAAAGRNRAHREEVKLDVQMARAHDIPGTTRQRRRIDYDEIEFAKILRSFRRQILNRIV